jgi:cobalt-zinc-cadmium resistance protein CzcA
LSKQYHVDVDAAKLNHYQVSLATLTGAIANANINVGGNYLDMGQQSFDVRGLGFITTLDDIRNVVMNGGNATLNNSIAIPARVRDVAEVSVGYAPRLGIVGWERQG